MTAALATLAGFRIRTYRIGKPIAGSNLPP